MSVASKIETEGASRTGRTTHDRGERLSKNKHIGTDFDAFLSEQGELEEATAVAVNRLIAWQVEQAISTACSDHDGFHNDLA